MKKADEFSKVLDLLNDEEMDELLVSAQGLIKAQGVVRVGLPKEKTCMKKDTPYGEIEGEKYYG